MQSVHSIMATKTHQTSVLLGVWVSTKRVKTHNKIALQKRKAKTQRKIGRVNGALLYHPVQPSVAVFRRPTQQNFFVLFPDSTNKLVRL
jgi:hypothetical protein